mgnify:CR=1 FL=1
MKKTTAIPRDPYWRVRRALGHKVVKLTTHYTRKVKHKAKAYA